jgi:fructokinase
MNQLRIGVDLGGTKIEAVVMDRDRGIIARERIVTPRGTYDAIVVAVADLVNRICAQVGAHARGVPVGVGIPGTISQATGLVKNANSTELIGHPLDRDLETALGRPVRLANDANCFALSETLDGAVGRAGLAPDTSSVFGVILGTGVGGGVVVRSEIVAGADYIAGEWGHNQLPWMNTREFPGPGCWCGKHGCIERFLSGPALASDHQLFVGEELSTQEIAQRAEDGDPTCTETLERYCDRLPRGLASILNVINPDAIVLGGGLSNMTHLYTRVPQLWLPYAFSDSITTKLLRAEHGDSSGVRGAAWLWG